MTDVEAKVCWYCVAGLHDECLAVNDDEYCCCSNSPSPDARRWAQDQRLALD